MNSMKKRITAALTAGILAAALAAPAQASAAAEPIRVSSYKGSTLEVGERSGLMIGPSGAEYTVTSSAPDIVAVEQVLTFWVAVAKAEGSAEITAVNSVGGRGTVTLAVGSAASIAPTDSDSENNASQTTTSNMDIRQEMIQLINQTRRENGVAELPVNDALMSAAQTIADKRYSWHHTQEECEAAVEFGYLNGFGTNLTVFTSVATEDTAQRAVDNWINSPGHFQTMIDPKGDCLGVGVAEIGTVTYCYMFIGIPNSVTPYG